MNVSLIWRIVIGAVALIGSGGTLAYLLNENKTIIEKGLIILGMQNSGKTTIYDFLQKTNKAGVTSKVDDYQEFKYTFKDKNSVTIRKGKDIGGRLEFVKPFYKKMINDPNVDVCFFVFNVFEYLNDEEYSGDVNARLHFLFENGILEKNYKIIGSYLDKFKVSEQSIVQARICLLVKDKSYSGLFSSHNFHLTNLTDEEQLGTLIETTLKK
jgi:hypothetical protein